MMVRPSFSERYRRALADAGSERGPSSAEPGRVGNGLWHRYRAALLDRRPAVRDASPDAVAAPRPERTARDAASQAVALPRPRDGRVPTGPGEDQAVGMPPDAGDSRPARLADDRPRWRGWSHAGGHLGTAGAASEEAVIGPLSVLPARRRRIAFSVLLAMTAVVTVVWAMFSVVRGLPLVPGVRVDHDAVVFAPRMTEQPEPVRSVAFSPDGRMMATGGAQAVRLWDVPTRKPIASLDSDTQSVWSLAFSPDGQLVAAGGEDGVVRLWNTADHERKAAWGGHFDRVQSMAFSLDGRFLASGSVDGVVLIWDVGTGDILRALKPERPEAVFSVTFSDKGRVLSVLHDLRTVRLWTFPDGKPIATIAMDEPRFPSAVGAPSSKGVGADQWIAARPDGRAVAIGYDGTVTLWQVTAPSRPVLISVLRLGARTGRLAAFSPDGHILAVGTSDGTVQLLGVTNPSRPRRLGSFSRVHMPIWSLTFSPDGHTLAIGGNRGTVRLYDTRRG